MILDIMKSLADESEGVKRVGNPASQLENSITDFQRMKSMLHTALHVLSQSITAKSGSCGLFVSVVLRLERSEQAESQILRTT